REPIKCLHRAHLFWLTRVDQTDDLALLEKFLHALQPEAGIIQSTYRPTRLRSLETGAEADLSVLQGARTVMVCGIANPASFERTLLELGADLMERFSFPDHHPFKASEMREVQNAAATKGAKLIVTTEKDGVRIPRDIQYKVPVYELNIEVHIIQGKEFLEKALWNRTSMQSCPKRN
ncbi:MAG: tetraacyldisaccharide 4'-kinase, partial [bacterium]